MELASAKGAALFYLEQGFSVIPLRKNKRPLLAWEEFQTRRPTPAEASAWFDKWPAAGVGIITGAVSADLFVLDVDVKPGAVEAMDALVGEVTTVMVMTGGAGLHLWFRAPGRELHNSAGKLATGLDTRGEGGYVVVPPSGHPSGRTYRFAPGRALGDVEIAPIPDALAELLTPPPPVQRAPVVPITYSGEPSPYARAAFDAELAELARQGLGTRNSTLNKAAFSLGQLVGGGELDRDQVEQALTETARGIGLDDDEIANTIKSGLGDGMAEPRRPEPRTPRRTRASLQAPAQPTSPPDKPKPDWERLVPDGGWLRRWCDLQASTTQAPVEFHLASGLAALSGTLGANVSFELGGRPWHATLWQLLMAPAGAHKSTPISAATRAVIAVRGAEVLLPSRWSPEAFYDALKSCQDGFWDIGEISAFLGQARSDYMAGVRGELCDAWDHRTMIRRTRKEGKITIPAPAITAVATGRIHDFEQAAGLADFKGGLLSRFLLVQASEPGEHRGLKHSSPAGSDERDSERKALYDHLEEVRTYLHPITESPPVAVKFEAEAEELWDASDQVWSTEEVSDELSGWASRRGIQALKIATLAALAERAQAEVILSDMQWAIELIETSWAAVAEIATDLIGLDRDAQKRSRLFDAARRLAYKQDGIFTERELHNRVWRLVRDRKETATQIDSWEAAGLVEKGWRQPTRGPATVAFRVVNGTAPHASWSYSEPYSPSEKPVSNPSTRVDGKGSK